MKNNTRICFVVLLFCISIAADAEDFGTWLDAGITKKLSTSGLSLSAEGGLRTNNRMRNVDRWSLGAGVDYKLHPYLKAEVGYTFIYEFNERATSYKYEGTLPDGSPKLKHYKVTSPFWRAKHRGFFSLSTSIGVGRFTFSLRERYQITGHGVDTVERYKQKVNLAQNPDGSYEYRPSGDPESDPDVKHAKTKHYLRQRLQAEYNIRHCPLTPFASIELSNNLANGFRNDKTRLTVGTDYKLTKKHRLSLSYIYQSGHDDEINDNIHVINLSYTYKL